MDSIDFMKYFVLIIGLLFAASFSSQAQNKKAEKEAAAQAAFEKASAAIDARNFVIIVDTYESSTGTIETNTDVATFFSYENDFAYLQGAIIAGNNNTNRLTVADFQKSTDKKGNLKAEMQVKGAFITAKIEIFMKKGGNYADVIITPTKGTVKRFSGEVVLKSESGYFKRPGEV